MSETQVKVEAPEPLAIVMATPTGELPKLWEKQSIKSDQDGIRENAVSLDARIHMNAVQCLIHAEKHGDTSLMRRLLIDIVDATTGYRRQGLIVWMRTFSPMTLDKDVIKLNGTLNGERKPFKCLEAYHTPFTRMEGAKEKILWRPVFRDNLVDKLARVVREYKAAQENTQTDNGKVIGPKVPAKAFYDGIHLDKMDAGFDVIEKALNDMRSFDDMTKDVRQAAETIKKGELIAAEAAGKH